MVVHDDPHSPHSLLPQSSTATDCCRQQHHTDQGVQLPQHRRTETSSLANPAAGRGLSERSGLCMHTDKTTWPRRIRRRATGQQHATVKRGCTSRNSAIHLVVAAGEGAGAAREDIGCCWMTERTPVNHQFAVNR
jgi:hypothetical protein